MMQRALSIDRTYFGEKHPNVAIRLNNLATLLTATERFEDAESLLRHAISIDEASFGENHPNVAVNLSNLAQLLQATNRLPEAEPLMRHALSIDEASFGENHPNMAIRLNNLAQLLRATNRLEEAEPLMRRAIHLSLEFTEKTEHKNPNYSRQLGNYQGLLKEMGLSEQEIEQRIDETLNAKPDSESPVEMVERLLGPRPKSD